MDPETDTRTALVRRMLVATVDSGLPSPRPVWRTAAMSVGAFALVGALAGVTVATVGTLQAGPAVQDYEPFEIDAESHLEDDVVIFGTPIVVTGSQPTTVDLGPAPSGANAVALAIYCLEAGAYTLALDGEFTMGTECTEESGPVGGGGASVQMFVDGPPQELSVDLDSGRYAVWAAWVNQPADGEPSAVQQDALADGAVTREEYIAGFERYVACMEDLGFVVSHGPLELEVLSYSIPGTAGNSGAANRCYESEFQLVDQEWQIAHQQVSDEQGAALIDGVTRAEYVAGFDRFVECVTPLGITVSVVDRDAEVLDYTVDASGGQPGESNRCYRLEFFSIDLAWRASVE
jgi:hypothetical protein